MPNVKFLRPAEVGDATVRAGTTLTLTDEQIAALPPGTVEPWAPPPARPAPAGAAEPLAPRPARPPAPSPTEGV
ncbi:hypothetical protein [Falsiroseomonas selenitidurans]|uniref:Uncharacterized protein n=1 Tax=Falsiroseomonas selenitidurans TaxID=2716335 RepID=A0ABX1E8G5_9PROT|nr:hypothetical protein [Falsiroseomonas selenitidurans]NKC33496.1 hypothetical protein [Falsiroseomonas selenitidurans]